jgi:hypothetical protein
VNHSGHFDLLRSWRLVVMIRTGQLRKPGLVGVDHALRNKAPSCAGPRERG